MQILKVLLAGSLIFFCSIQVKGQKTICGNPADTVQKGQLKIKKSKDLNALLKHTKMKNRGDETFQGYRIQIYFGKKRQKAQDIKARFYKHFPGKRAYMVYEQPNFKIRVGNFRNKMEAQKLFYKLKEEFSTVLIVPTKIDYPQLKEK